MTAIKDMEKLHNKQLETLKRRKEREISKLEDNHQNHKAEIKKVHADEIIDIQDENYRQVAQEADKKEKVLTEMRNHLQSTQEMTDKELRELKTSSAKTNEDVKEQSRMNQEIAVAENQLRLDELNQKFQAETRNLNDTGKMQTANMKTTMQRQYVEEQGLLQKKINDQAISFTERYTKENNEQKKLMDQTQQKNRKDRLDLNVRQQTQLGQLTETHNNLIEKRDTEFQKGLKEQDVFFEKKYAINHAAHTKDANNLDDRYHGLMNDMKLDLSKKLEQSENRLDDPFYQFSELRPTWSRTEDIITIKVKIPEHSKQDLQLFINGKEAVLSFNRRFNDANKSVDGVANKITKIETFTSRIPMDAILNPKSVKASYENGTMTYTVTKA